MTTVDGSRGVDVFVDKGGSSTAGGVGVVDTLVEGWASLAAGAVRLVGALVRVDASRTVDGGGVADVSTDG